MHFVSLYDACCCMQRRKKTNADKQRNRAFLTKGCKFNVYVTWSRAVQRYIVKTKHLEHNHDINMPHLNISLHQGFPTLDDAITQVEECMKRQRLYQPLKRETKESVRNFNNKCRTDARRITELPETAQYSQRLVSTRFSTQLSPHYFVSVF